MELWPVSAPAAAGGEGPLRMRAVAQRHEGQVRPFVLDRRVCAALVDAEPSLHFGSPASPSAKCAIAGPRSRLRLPTGRGGNQRRRPAAQTPSPWPSSINSPGEALSACGFGVESQGGHETAEGVLVVVARGAGRASRLSIMLGCGIGIPGHSLSTLHTNSTQYASSDRIASRDLKTPSAVARPPASDIAFVLLFSCRPLSKGRNGKSNEAARTRMQAAKVLRRIATPGTDSRPQRANPRVSARPKPTQD